jgi:hypothetical protein
MARLGGASPGPCHRASRKRRWKHYYTAEELLDALREAVSMRDASAKIAGLQEDEAPQADDADNEADAMLFRQTG